MKMPLRVYNRFLDLLGETDSYQSLQYKRSYHGVGDFELHINRYMHGADDFQKGNIIAMNKQENKAGLITSREIELNENGKESENFKLTGITMDGLMNRRISVPPSDTAYDRKSGDAESVMKHYVYNHFVNPADKSRKLDMLEIAPNQNRGENVSWESRFKVIGEELEKISIESGLGWGIFVDYNTKKLVFDCLQAKNLIQKNEFGYPPVFFSPEFETIKSQSFIDSDQDYKNVGYIGGQGEGTDRKIVESGDSTGWERIETFVDARDVGSDEEGEDEELSDEEIEKRLKNRGKEKMKEMETVFSLEAEILTPITRKAYEYTHEGYLQPTQPTGSYESKQQQITPFQYEKDFDLGDRVEIVNKSWGLTMNAPITEFLEVHEAGGFRLEGTFGQSRPNLITKIQDKFNELEGVDKQEAPAAVAVEYMKQAMKYGDENLTKEQRERIEQAMENLEAAKENMREYTYDKDSIDEKDKEVADYAKQDAKEKADAAQFAAEKVADAKAKLAETEAKAHADGKISDEEKRAIRDAKDKLEEAKEDAKKKANAAEKSAKDYAELKASEAQTAAEDVAEAKAKLAETQAKSHADDKITKEEQARIEQAKADLKEAKAAAELAETEAKAYSDGKITTEEKRAIKDAKAKLAEAKKHADDADKIVEENAKKDASDKADKAESSAKKHAEDKAQAAQEAAEAVADAKSKLAEENAIANADGKITSEEKKRIEQAEENLSAAKADAKAKADAAERAANAYSESEDKKVKDEAAKDAKDKADQAEKNANDFSKNADNIMEGILDVGTVPIRTAYSGARIEFDGTNGFVQYNKNDEAVQWFDLDGGGQFTGSIITDDGAGGVVRLEHGEVWTENNGWLEIGLTYEGLIMYGGNDEPYGFIRASEKIEGEEDASQGFSINTPKSFITIGFGDPGKTDQRVFLATRKNADSGRVEIYATESGGSAGQKIPHFNLSNYRGNDKEGNNTRWSSAIVYAGRDNLVPYGSDRRFGFEVWQYTGDGKGTSKQLMVLEKETSSRHVAKIYAEKVMLNGLYAMASSISSAVQDQHGTLNRTLHLYIGETTVKLASGSKYTYKDLTTNFTSNIFGVITQVMSSPSVYFTSMPYSVSSSGFRLYVAETGLASRGTTDVKVRYFFYYQR